MDTKIIEAGKEDYPEILALQHLAFEDEAQLLNNWQIKPLTQTLEEMEQECHGAVVLKLVTQDGRIIGSVRAKAETWTVEVGKLMVHPDYRGQGYGRQLLRAVEDIFTGEKLEGFELFTSSLSVANIRLYESVGYKITREQQVNDRLTLVYLFKKQQLRYPVLTMAEYEEQALRIIRKSFPEAEHSCFSGVYGLGYFNSLDRASFVYGASSWEYPGSWYAAPMKITGERFVELLVEDGLLCLQGKCERFDKNVRGSW